MLANADVTVYNKYVDPTTRAEVYQRAQVKRVTWESRKAANVIQSGGQISVDQASIYIPFARGTDYRQPRAWQALTTKTGKWTLQVGDIVVKGLVSDTIGANFTISDLKAKYDDVLVISSVDTMDALSLKHWQVGAK